MSTEHTMTSEALHKDSTTFFGFWMYLMTDFILFAALFATYAVLRVGVGEGPTPAEIFSAPFVFLETLILLTSSFVAGFALLAARAGKTKSVVVWLVITALLGLSFVSLEFSEFAKLIAAGHGWQQSAFLSSYFTLVGTHGLHIIIGLLWVTALIISIVRRGLVRSNLRKLVLWSVFWHFLDLIWICIFTIVYLLAL